jgi:hypothetical protein
VLQLVERQAGAAIPAGGPDVASYVAVDCQQRGEDTREGQPSQAEIQAISSSTDCRRQETRPTLTHGEHPGASVSTAAAPRNPNQEPPGCIFGSRRACRPSPGHVRDGQRTKSFGITGFDLLAEDVLA